MDALWVIGIALPIITGLIAVIYFSGQRRDDKQDERFEKIEEKLEAHIKDDVQAHERIQALETDMENVKTEDRRLSKNIHDLRNGIQQTVREWVPVWVAKFLRKDDK